MVLAKWYRTLSLPVAFSGTNFRLDRPGSPNHFLLEKSRTTRWFRTHDQWAGKEALLPCRYRDSQVYIFEYIVVGVGELICMGTRSRPCETLAFCIGLWYKSGSLMPNILQTRRRWRPCKVGLAVLADKSTAETLQYTQTRADGPGFCLLMCCWHSKSSPWEDI